MSLGRYYADEPVRRLREVALYIDGKYVTRGPCTQACDPARWGFRGLGEVVSPDRMLFELDCTPDWDPSDRVSLMWGRAAERLTAAQFLAWHEAAI